MTSKNVKRQEQNNKKEQGFVITFWSEHVVQKRRYILVPRPDAFNQYFRLLDDDGNVYFRGFQDPVNFDEFAPLDWYGESYGCTELQYKEDGKWISL